MTKQEFDNASREAGYGACAMNENKKLKRRIERLEKRLEAAEVHGRALEKVIKSVICDASKSAFEFAVKQYRWQELHEKHQRAVEEAIKGRPTERRDAR